MSDVTYKLEELARAAGISARTVRYYVQRGLVPAPAFRGKDTAYGHEHLVRLRAIRRLQEAFFPLDAIAVELGRRTIAEIERLASGAEMPGLASVASVPNVTSEELSPPAPLTPGRSMQPASGGATRLPPRTFRRFEIAPGVELSIADDAPPESRAAAEKILAGLQREEGA